MVCFVLTTQPIVAVMVCHCRYCHGDVGRSVPFSHSSYSSSPSFYLPSPPIFPSLLLSSLLLSSSLISLPVFHKLRGDQALLQKIVYILANLVGVGLAIYKFNNMGLLPTAQSDWLEFMEARRVSITSRLVLAWFPGSCARGRLILGMRLD